ncbi:MAG: FtsX-like permease family protein, partial [Planctomycetota bacterium]
MKLSGHLLLTLAAVTARPGRAAATALALGFAGALLLLALVGSRQVRENADRVPDALLAANELHLTATDPAYPFLPADLLDDVRADSRVAGAVLGRRARVFDLPGTEDGGFDVDAFYNGSLNGWVPGRRLEIVAWEPADGADEETASFDPRGTLAKGRRPVDRKDGVVEVAIPRNEVWRFPLGAKLRLECDAGAVPGEIVGLLELPESFVGTEEAMRLVSWEATPAAAARLAGGEPPVSEIRLTLREEKRRGAFLADWSDRLAALPGRVEAWDRALIRERAGGSFAVAIGGSVLALTTLVLLCGGCAAGAALGAQGAAVRERTAQYALLRSLGATAGTLATTILFEAAVLAGLGLAVAVAGAWAVTKLLPMLGFSAALDAVSVAATGAVLLGGTLLGTVGPARAAFRVGPSGAADRLSDPEAANRRARRRALAAAGALIAAG